MYSLSPQIAGLWSYNVGDTVQFTSLRPYRVIVSGRVKHFISAFGEHVIGKEVEEAMKKAQEEFNCIISEFTVAPQTEVADNELPFHEWFIEFEQTPENILEIAASLDTSMQQQNSYYFDLIQGKSATTPKNYGPPQEQFSEIYEVARKVGRPK